MTTTLTLKGHIALESPSKWLFRITDGILPVPGTRQQPYRPDAENRMVREEGTQTECKD